MTSTNHSARRRKGLAFFALVSLVLAACSDDNKTSETTAASVADVTTTSEASGETTPSTAAPIEGDTTGITDDTIRISVTGPWSGPLASIAGTTWDNGYKLYQDEINAAGGINGRQLEFVKVDNQNTPEGAASACLEVAENETFAVMGSVSAGSDLCYEEAQIPDLVLNPREYEDGWEYVISVAVMPKLAPVEASFLASDYLNAADHTVGMFTNGDSIGLAEQSDAVADALGEIGIEVVQTEVLSADAASFVAEVTRMKEAGVDLVILNTGLLTIGILRDAASIGYSPQYYAGPASAIDLVAMATGGQMSGVKATRAVNTVDSQAFKDYQDQLATLYGEEAAAKASTLDAQAYAQARILGHILELTGTNLNRESFIAAARTVQDFDSELFGMISFDAEGPMIGLKTLYPIECCGDTGVFFSLGDGASEF